MTETHNKVTAPGRVKEVTSLANPLVKDIKALALKKFRERENAFLAEGLKLVLDALEAGWTIKFFIFAKSGRGNAVVEKAAARTVAAGGTVLEVSEKVLSAITRKDNPQMVAGVFEQRYRLLKEIKPAAGDVYVALDRVRDPGNLGTIIRAADAAGADAVILTGRTVDPYNPKVVRATTGSLFHLPVALGVDLATAVERAHAVGVRVIAADVGGEDFLESRGLLSEPTAWLFGNEARGLGEEALALADLALRLPIYGKAESLNLATAASVCLYETAFAQRAGE